MRESELLEGFLGPADDWQALAPYFSPPAQFAGQFGTYRSPLKFEDGSEVKDAKDWPRRRAEILHKWHDVLYCNSCHMIQYPIYIDP